MYQYLCAVYGANDIKRNYISFRYPYACDFYILSRDMYIELNSSWTHGGHWFDADRDTKLVQHWLSKDTAYYDNAVSTWTGRDVKKRECAKGHCLNYVVFWDSKLRDADLWFALGCPNGHDWEREYSWLPAEVLAK